MLPGYDPLYNLLSALVNRRHAVIVEIKSMFHQEHTKLLDTDSLRFIRREKLDNPLLDHVMLVHVFGKVDSSYSLRELPKYTDL